MADTSALTPIEPDPHYRRTLFDRYGPDAGYRMRAVVYSVPALFLALLVGGFLGGQLGLMGGARLLFTVAVVLIVWPGAMLVSLLITDGVAKTVGHAVMPSGASTPYEQTYSAEETLLIRGQVREALDAFALRMQENPADAKLHLRVGDIWAKEGGDPRRAAELYRAVQRMTGITAGDDIYATSRLIDLYVGPLAEPKRALPELRKLIDKYPSTPAGQHARGALARLKEELVGRE